MKGFRIATLFGIPIEINVSWLIIFTIIFWSLSAAVFPMTYPGLGRGVYLLMGAVTTVLFFASLIAHELSHSLVSQHFGLRVRRIVLFVFGGISETTQELPSPAIEFKVAIAGPLMSFALGALFALLARGLDTMPGFFAAAGVCAWLAVVNLALGLFNLLPGFPLDGGRVLRAAAWQATGSLRRATRIASRGGQIVGGLLMLWGLLRVMAGDLFGAIWIGFIGYLLFQAAASQYGEMVLHAALSGVGVGDLMTRDPQVLDPDMTLSAVVDDYLLRYPYEGYPVVDGHLDGLLQAKQVKAVPPEEWSRRRVREVMTPLGDAQALDPHASVADALQRFSQLDVGRLPVVEEGRVIGMLSQSDVIRYLAWHPEIEKSAGT
ncbi:site-2 protease family protein [bacterium]|nr:site-2 protease family protein [bacterium]